MARFLSMRQASEHLGGTPSTETLYRLAREGHLPVKRIGRKVVISEMRLDEWANEPGDARARFYPGMPVVDDNDISEAAK
jgi:excisionase family DNA binding protein